MRAARTSARRAPRADAPVVWRDGVHLAGTMMWCDARRARAVCFVSAAGKVGRAAHGQLIGSAATLAQLGATGAPHLAVPMRRPFSLGNLELELRPNGNGVGGAMLVTTVAGRRIVYAGAPAPGGVGLGGAAVLPPCDVLVLIAHHQRDRGLASPAAARDAMLAWTREVIAAGQVPVLLTPDAHHALDLTAALRDAGIGYVAHRTARELARRMADVPGLDLPRQRGGKVQLGEAVVWPLHVDDGLRRTLHGLPHRIAGVFVHAQNTELLATVGATFGIPWAPSGFRDELIELARGSTASEIYVLGGAAVAVAAALGPRGHVLAPPTQLPLFQEA
jgi:hypothetical protein